MKRVSILFTAMILVAAGIFTSCEEEANMAPIITFTNGISSVDLEAGDTEHTITGTIEAEAGLDEVKIFQVTDAGETQLGSAITDFKAGSAVVEGADGITYNFSFDILGITDDIVVKVEATDKDNQTASKNFTITAAGAVGGAIETFTAVLMGAQDNASNGSAMDASTGTVYTLSAANTNSALIDVIYFYGASNLATLTAPDDVTVGGTAGNLTLAANYATKNATRFNSSPGISSSDFDGYTDDMAIAAVTDITDSKVNQLSQNDVIAFETVDGKMGLIKVDNISTGATGSITITVKIQE